MRSDVAPHACLAGCHRLWRVHRGVEVKNRAKVGWLTERLSLGSFQNQACKTPVKHLPKPPPFGFTLSKQNFLDYCPHTLLWLRRVFSLLSPCFGDKDIVYSFRQKQNKTLCFKCHLLLTINILHILWTVFTCVCLCFCRDIASLVGA